MLLVDGEAVADSTRILQRIDAISGAFSAQLDEQARAEAWLWEDFADTALNGFLVAARWAHDETWPRIRDAYLGPRPGSCSA
ncbi:MAG TPA: hypothetical protein VJV78_10645 [Polyangiales bacterium]|nr:hypothetical protein [Polyangiales bacterium]